MAEPQRDPVKLVVFNFLQYLADLRANDATLAAVEGIEVATNCLAEAFSLQELDDAEQQKKYSIKPMALPAVIEAARIQMEMVQRRTAGDAEDPQWIQFLAKLKKSAYFTAAEGTPEYQKQVEHARGMFKLKHAAKPVAPAASATAKPAPGVAAAPPVALSSLPPDVRKKRIDEAEKYKAEGNQKLSDRQYHAALEAYSKAIELNPGNAIYFGNRAAAYEFLGDSEKAIIDCKESIRLDPNYAKAYSRLGLSYFSLGCYKDAVEQYRQAVQLDQANTAYRESLTKAELKLAQHPDAHTYATRSTPAVTPAAAGASTPGGPAPAAAAQPTLPPFDPEAMKGMMNDIGGLGNIMSNPAFLGMAQKMMSDPQFMSMATNMMQNPEMAQMLGNMAAAQKK